MGTETKPSWRLGKRWIVAATLTLGAAHLYGRHASLPGYWFAPLAVGLVLAAFALGMRRTSSALLGPRLRKGSLWATIVAALMPIPWAVRWGLFWLAASSIPAPATAPDDPIHVVSNEPYDWPVGFQVMFLRSDVSVDDIERFYRVRLPRRGWRFAWSRDIKIPATGVVIRRCCFRRPDGLMVISTAVSDPENFVVAYDHLGSEDDWR